MKKHWIGIAALLTAIAALGLAIIPPIALGRPNAVLGWLEPEPPPDPVQINSDRPLIGIKGEIQFHILDGADESPDEGAADEHPVGDSETSEGNPSLAEKARNLLRSFSRGNDEEEPQEEQTEPNTELPEQDGQTQEVEAEQVLEDPAKEQKEGLFSKLPRGFKISINNQGGAEQDGEDNGAREVAPAVPKPGPTREERLANRFAVASGAAALAGLLLGIVAFRWEKRRSLAVGAISCSCVALTWQYVVAGIVIATTIVALIILLAVLAQVFS